MEKIRISKVEDVTLWRRGIKVDGTLHLTSHHLIFSYVTPPQADQPQATTTPPKPRELWITYPMIAYCAYRPSPVASRQQPSIRLRCRDFTFVSFHFDGDAKAKDVFETIRNLACRLGKIEKLYAFSYTAQGPEKTVNGWKLYDPMKEWQRLGVGSKGTNRGWRISHINTDYQYSPTYPALLPVPASISDNVLNYAGRYRSRTRIPILTYLHPVNDCSITRCSQPLVGVRGHRSVQDERLVAAIFATSKPQNGSVEHSEPPSEAPSGVATPAETPQISPEHSIHTAEALEHDAVAKLQDRQDLDLEDVKQDQASRIYGAQQHNLIVDARPTVNAFAMQAIGMGSENMDNYRFATKAYLGIDNIHVMRDSLNKVVEAFRDTDVTPMGPSPEMLAKSGWLKHISVILDGAGLVARQVGIHHSHVLLHCSDGWDRTSQLSALSQLCLDPYYRTLEGFMVLVEKDWLSFGHMFRHRSGFLGSEKWFDVENERIAAPKNDSFPVDRGVNHAFESALRSAKGFFNKHNNESRESFGDSDGEMQSMESSPRGKSSPSATKPSAQETSSTKVKETSPVFHQFLDATYQLLYQYPTRFEFNERFLRRLLYHLYSCQYGTFLYDSEKQRVDAKVSERTRSVWDYFLARKEQFTNNLYDGAIDDNVRGHERLIIPDHRNVRWWIELFGRTDEEMNKPAEISASLPPRSKSPALTGVETADLAIGPGAAGPKEKDINGSADALARGVSGMNMGARYSMESDKGQPVSAPMREQMELEME